MPAADVEETAVLKKCLVLLAKMSGRLAQIDRAQFPTDESEAARGLLALGIDNLRTASAQFKPSPYALYRQLLVIQQLLDDVESSSIDYIAWPVVSYINEIWSKLFAGKPHQVFFTRWAEYNYGIYNFTEALGRALEGLIPSGSLAVPADTAIYCLRLASIEVDNIPLYANIGHELGHVLFHLRSKEVTAIWGRYSESLAGLILAKLTDNAKQADLFALPTRLQKIRMILDSLVEELTADMVGTLLMGPSFFLSLQEVSWSSTTRDVWTARMFVKPGFASAYPGFNFRLGLVSSTAGVQEAFKDVEREYARLDPSMRMGFPDLGGTSSWADGNDRIEVMPESDVDQRVLQRVLNECLPEAKKAFEGFAREVLELLAGDVGLPEASAEVVSRNIAQLLVRLAHGIPPNIVPSNAPGKELLGIPAEFSDILQAASLYRMSLLAGPSFKADESGARKLSEIEGLVRKGLEVSYIQRTYPPRDAAEGSGDGSSELPGD